ncbi:hypothetical protein BU25DRAFT_237981 [Macroventuria anomochaeta]|uniref:Uncharacterized protein n=1 Tax=Macroventuria anomochaeta TaxID=301207 RepID=A0ACB6RJE5_9PLEO|nr:uncharacterized protein BU25DRAFT_237981 [Macroventuria anomochaeta]KAF2621462.1 hypothetical protein BU25DRAFT_237981 [Macroventuria anomochaeta]
MQRSRCGTFLTCLWCWFWMGRVFDVLARRIVTRCVSARRGSNCLRMRRRRVEMPTCLARLYKCHSSKETGTEMIAEEVSSGPRGGVVISMCASASVSGFVCLSLLSPWTRLFGLLDETAEALEEERSSNMDRHDELQSKRKNQDCAGVLGDVQAKPTACADE